VQIAAYNPHCPAPFLRTLVGFHRQVYSAARSRLRYDIRSGCATKGNGPVGGPGFARGMGKGRVAGLGDGRADRSVRATGGCGTVRQEAV